MAIKRTSIGNKKRFDIFKRDNFTCQYCGSNPPSVILEVDHINPVSNGGNNHIDNLITSCFNCNRGKRDHLLTTVPQSLQDKANEIKEREAQIIAYQKVLNQKLERIEDEGWIVCEILKPQSSTKGFNKLNFKSITNFIDKIGVHEVMEAAEIAKSTYGNNYNRCFLYFCGICWNKVKGN